MSWTVFEGETLSIESGPRAELPTQAKCTASFSSHRPGTRRWGKGRGIKFSVRTKQEKSFEGIDRLPRREFPARKVRTLASSARRARAQIPRRRDRAERAGNATRAGGVAEGLDDAGTGRDDEVRVARFGRPRLDGENDKVRSAQRFPQSAHGANLKTHASFGAGEDRGRDRGIFPGRGVVEIVETDRARQPRGEREFSEAVTVPLAAAAADVRNLDLGGFHRSRCGSVTTGFPTRRAEALRSR